MSTVRGRRLSPSSSSSKSRSSMVPSSSSLFNSSTTLLPPTTTPPDLPSFSSSSSSSVNKRSTGSVRRISSSISRPQRTNPDNTTVTLLTSDQQQLSQQTSTTTTTESSSFSSSSSSSSTAKEGGGGGGGVPSLSPHRSFTRTAKTKNSSKNTATGEISITSSSSSTYLPHKKTLSFTDLQEGPTHWHHLIDNEHIQTGYRRGNHSWYDALATLFHLHNETWNVWSHLLGACLFVGLFFHIVVMGGLEPSYTTRITESFHEIKHTLVYTVRNGTETLRENVSSSLPSTSSHISSLSSSSPPPQWPIGIFLLSAIICLLSSASFHLLHIVNKRIFEILARIDYVGIAVLIAGSNVPCVVYGFYCHPVYFYGYLALQTFFCGVAGIMGLMDRFQSPEWRFRRALVFIATGGMGIIPSVHIYTLYSATHPEIIDILYGLMSMGLQYIVGALLYAGRIPERFFPGKFDFAFSSHGIFHVLVGTAAYTHYLTVIQYYTWRIQHSNCAAE